MWRSLLPNVLLLAAFLTGCSNTGNLFQDRFFALGTLIEVSIYGVDPALAAQASEQIEHDFLIMHANWHAWQPGALVTTNKQLASMESFTPAPSVQPLLQEAGRLSQLSNGLFNPVMGKLIALWGFHDNALPVGSLPDTAAISALVEQAPSADDVTFTGTQLVSHNPAVSYDLGAFAKGYAIDRAIEHLREFGIQNAIINAGGDLRAIGQHGDRPWRIGIRHPRQNGILASIEIDGDASVFTSGDYERFFEVDGKRYHHIIDPRSGYPADKTISVTVIHGNAATADAASTALFVAGPDDWVKIARNMHIGLVMLIGTNGIIHMSPAMQSRIHLEPDTAAEIRLSEPLS
ncbi:MAG: FAD:protein FMN transferase [Gammaproteobacteria bacterium]|nr:FAD:protein FMN transferase [Gammaproteobacteria bacterium]